MKNNRFVKVLLFTALVIPTIIASNLNPADAQSPLKKDRTTTSGKPFYQRNIGEVGKIEIDSTGGGIRFKNGVRFGVERIETGKPEVYRRGNTTIIDSNPKKTGIGINYKF